MRMRSDDDVNLILADGGFEFVIFSKLVEVGPCSDLRLV